MTSTRRWRRPVVDAPPTTFASPPHTSGEAWSERLRCLEHDRARRPSTVGDYRTTVQRYLPPAFGADTPVAAITTDDIDAFRERLLDEGRLSRRTIQKILVRKGVTRRAGGPPEVRPGAVGAAGRPRRSCAGRTESP